ncbi:MAG: N-acetyl-gamma-glutamyl-phosphate reductase [Oscillospiraceae bacterium]|nr:N-acetyl-gamma-glutamyl-phosphate reductase [Oscillospiraceae bacterium]
MKRIFIDGSSGTTGLRIHQRLEGRKDIELVQLPEELKKNQAAKREMLNDGCDVAVLCLPDEAAIEAVAMVENPAVTVLDASTAHRTDSRFVYGFPELGEKFRSGIQSSRRVANPGCHASGFIALVYPLVEAGLIAPDTPLVCHSLTGYSGGGKKMIAQYEAPERDRLLDAPRQYGLNQSHKHLREMAAVTGLTTAPIFCPIVGDFYSGMEVTVALFARDLKGTESDVREAYARKYTGPVVTYRPDAEEGGFLSAGALSDRDGMEISVHGNSERLLLTARFDNLGKGASGAAVQNLNLILGAEETTGLTL